MHAFLNAREAAAELNVSRATLYAYVSRGMIRSEPAENGRHRLYHADDVRNLRARKSPTADGRKLTDATFLESAITLIDAGRCYYRGRDALQLSAVATLESVAGLLWQCGERDPFEQDYPPLPAIPDIVSPYARMQAILAAAAPNDMKALNLRPWGVAGTGARVLRLLVAAIVGGAPGSGPIHRQLAAAWGASPEAADVIRTALVLSADHELNVSAFTVRCVASARSTPYAAVQAGLTALQGPRHGGQTARVAALFDEAAELGDAAVAARLQRGETLPGIGQFLYPDGDPRYGALIEALDRNGFDNESRQTAESLAKAAIDLTDLAPNIDFGLATVQRTIGLPTIAPLAIFAVGRCVGWIAHAQEQYENPDLIRPRARYVGESPQPAPATSK
ncbi:MAG: citrate synthase family protein [Rhodospirillaceae bacterium]|nr:citrate synthase family protein [Rhodospirillaceae bacterium]MDD9917889.1 citrate synthase family protein [Rhodospirillaceae bacterium]MDD9926834.1 citrate synthase family protein [Rhodospirillaceae bacterium]